MVIDFFLTTLSMVNVQCSFSPRLLQMGVATALSLPDESVDIVSSFVGRPWSLAGSCGSCGDDIANMDDVSDEMIAILTQGRIRLADRPLFRNEHPV